MADTVDISSGLVPTAGHGASPDLSAGLIPNTQTGEDRDSGLSLSDLVKGKRPADEDLARHTTARWVEENRKRNGDEVPAGTVVANGVDLSAGMVKHPEPSKAMKWLEDTFIGPFRRSGAFVGEFGAAGEMAAEKPEFSPEAIEKAKGITTGERVAKGVGTAAANAATGGAYGLARLIFDKDNPQAGFIGDPVTQEQFAQTRDQLTKNMERQVATGEKTEQDVRDVYQGASDLPILLAPTSRTASAITKPVGELAEGVVTRTMGKLLPKVEGGLANAAQAEIEGAAVKRMIHAGGQFAAFNFKYGRPESEETGADILGRLGEAGKGFGVGMFLTPALHLIGKPMAEIVQARIAGAWKPVAEWWAGKGAEKEVQRDVMTRAVNEMQASGKPPAEWMKGEVENLGLQTKALVNGLRQHVGVVQQTTVEPEMFLNKIGAPKGENVIQNAEDQATVDHFRERYKKGEPVEPIKIEYGSDAQPTVSDADGRHRALAAMQAGVERIPVTVERLSPAGELAKQEAENVERTGTYGEEAKPARREMARENGGTVNISVGAMRAAKVGIVHLTGRLQALEGMAKASGFGDMAGQAGTLRAALNGAAELFHGMTREWGLIGQELQRPLTTEEVAAGGRGLEEAAGKPGKNVPQGTQEAVAPTQGKSSGISNVEATEQASEGASQQAVKAGKSTQPNVDEAIDSMRVKQADINGWIQSLERIGRDVEMVKPGAQHSSLYQSVMGPDRLKAAIRVARMGLLSLTSPVGAGLHSSAWAMTRLGENWGLDVMDRVAGKESDRFSQSLGAMVRAIGRGTAEDLSAGFSPVSRRVGEFLRQSFGALKSPASVLGEGTAQPIVGKTADKFLYPHVETLGRVSSVFGDFAYETALHEMALQDGQRAGLKGMALTAHVRDLVQNPSQDMLDHAANQMRAAMFRRDLPKVVEDLTRSPLATLFVNPFTHFSAQALRMFAEFTVASPDFWSKVAHNEATGQDLTKFAMRNLQGIGAVYAVNRLLYDRTDFNRMEYVREDGKRISLRGTTPIVDLLAVAAAIRGDYASAARAAQSGVMMFPVEGGIGKQFLDSAKDAFASGGKGNPGRIVEELNRMIASTYPGNKVLAAINSLITRDVKSYAGPFGSMAKTPGLSNLARPQINPTTGEPLQSNREILGSEGVPSPDIGARGVQQSLNPVERMLAELGFSRMTPRGPKLLDPETLEPGKQPQPYKTPADVPENMRESYEQARGKLMSEFLTPIATDTRFRDMPYALQQKVVKRAIAKAERFARLQTNAALIAQHRKQLAVSDEETPSTAAPVPQRPPQTQFSPMQQFENLLQLDQTL